jgi:putative transposase
MIINTDQGAQYTSPMFTNAVTSQGVQLSMDGKGRAIDNVFTERFWRTLKYEEVYLRSYTDGLDAWQRINSYISYYNNQRSHSALGRATPKEVFEAGMK